MKKNSDDRFNIIGGIVVGIILCLAFVLWILPRFSKVTLTDAKVASNRIENYREVEAVCGKENVETICDKDNNQCQSNPDGFTCDNWRMVLHPEEYDKYGQRIYEYEK